MSTETVSTTFSVPTDLLEATDRVVREGKAGSRDQLVAAALRHELEAIQRTEIDAAFAALADDPDHQAETRMLDAEFAGASWEALRHANNRSHCRLGGAPNA